MNLFRRIRLLATALLVCTPLLTLGAAGPAPEEAAADELETPWPYEVKDGAATITVHQPQIDAWDGVRLQARAAVSVHTGGDQPAPTYGVVHLSAATLVDKAERIVTLDRLQIDKAEFPSAKDNGAAWVKMLEADAKTKTRTISLDRLEASLQIVKMAQEQQGAPLLNKPPQIIFSTRPAMLIYIDGMPAYRAIEGSSYQRIVNTRALLVKSSSGRHYLHLFDGWMTTDALLGEWSVASAPPPELKGIEQKAIESRQVDLLTGQSDPEQPAPSLAQSGAPRIYIASTPTEMIVTDGEPKWVPIPGTQLLFVENTTGHVFKLLGDQKTYLLASGRWFRASDVNGPWEFVPADMLAKDFAKIPDDSPKENVKASVAGTPQSKEAAIASSIPTTAGMKKSEATMTSPQYDGTPRLVAINGTSLQYVVNTATPIVMVHPQSYYAVENGVWFTANSLQGPWSIATSVPAEIYKIPPSCPIHYVTYVKVYDVVDDTVYVGYTQGYKGETVDPVTHVVVYGTGYYYTPWVGAVWYGPPVTYGFGVAMRYTPWTGWTVGFGFGWYWGPATVAIGWGWGPYPWWGPYGWGWSWGPPYYPIYPAPYWGMAAGPRGAMAWGPGGWVGSTGNMYRRWGDTATVSRVSGGYNAWTGNRWASHVGMSYNSSTGVLAAGQRGAVRNVYTGDYATGGRGVATGPGGITAAGRGGTVGNIYTGNEVSGGRGVIYNENTGNATRVGGVKGEQGGAIRVGDEVFAGQDGNVYRRTEGGGWEQVTRPQRASQLPANPPSSNRPSTTDTRSLNQQHYSRDTGAQRYDMNRGATRSMQRSYGGGRRR